MFLPHYHQETSRSYKYEMALCGKSCVSMQVVGVLLYTRDNIGLSYFLYSLIRERSWFYPNMSRIYGNNERYAYNGHWNYITCSALRPIVMSFPPRDLGEQVPHISSVNHRATDDSQMSVNVGLR